MIGFFWLGIPTCCVGRRAGPRTSSPRLSLQRLDHAACGRGIQARIAAVARGRDRIDRPCRIRRSVGGETTLDQALSEDGGLQTLRALAADCLAMVSAIADQGANVDKEAATRDLNLVLEVKGFGHVKQRNWRQVEQRWREAKQRWSV